MQKRIACWLILTALIVLPAFAAENSRLVLVRASVGWGVQGESAGLRVTTSALPVGYSASTPGASLLQLYNGFLAPATDRAGVIDADRIAEVIVGRGAAAEFVATDFAGNRDGVVDIGDLVTVIHKGVH